MNNNIVELPNRARITEEAGQWLVRLDADSPLSGAEIVALKAWLAKSPEHKTIILEMAQLWTDMDLLANASLLLPLDETSLAEQGTRHWSPFKITALGSALVMTLVLALLLLRPGSGSIEPVTDEHFAATYQTVIGQQEDVLLPDGSTVLLNTNTLLTVDFSASQRNLKLLRGEAHFEVAHDSEHPFIVKAAEGAVRAVGTAFSIRLQGNNAEVIVTKGTVEVSTDQAALPANTTVQAPKNSAPAPIRASAGESVTYNISSSGVLPVTTVPEDQLEKKLSWQEGILTFNGDALEDVIRELSRYTDTEIVISDPAIRDTSVGGRFKVGETDTLLTVLQDSFGIRVNRINDKLVYLSESVAD